MDIIFAAPRIKLKECQRTMEEAKAKKEAEAENNKDIEGACAAGIYAILYQGYIDGSARRSLQNNINTHIPAISDWNDFIRMLKRS